MWKFVTSQDCIGQIVGYWERVFSLCLVHSPAYLAEWIKNAWLWLPFYLGHCSGLFTHPITLGNEIMFIPRKREDLLTACSKSGGFFHFNKWISSAMQTHCLHRIHLGHVLSPFGTGGKENWCKYDNIYAISCAMSNKSFALTHESYIFCQYPWHINRQT